MGERMNGGIYFHVFETAVLIIRKSTQTFQYGIFTVIFKSSIGVNSTTESMQLNETPHTTSSKFTCSRYIHRIKRKYLSSNPKSHSYVSPQTSQHSHSFSHTSKRRRRSRRSVSKLLLILLYHAAVTARPQVVKKSTGGSSNYRQSRKKLRALKPLHSYGCRVKAQCS